MINKILILLTLAAGVTSCTFPDRDSLLEPTKDAIWAIPIINDEIKLQDLFTSSATTDVEITSDEEGKVTVSYEGEVLNDPASVVFPPIVGIFPISFSDTVFQIDLSQGATLNIIDSAEFLRDQIFFKYSSTDPDPLTITLTVNEMKLNGEPLTQTILHPGSPDGSPVEIDGPPISVEGYYMAGNNNIITFEYDARKANGERIKIEKITFVFNIFEFEYIQGFFPFSSREVAGSFIPINLYDHWIGGTMDFVEPNIDFKIENSFGFAVGADFKEMSIENLSGEKFELESSLLDEGIVFDFPGFDEIGDVKFTNFNFNKDNSNFKLIFNDRVKQFNYVINAIANPEDDPDFLGFMRSDSYYAVALKVDVPMHLAINNLQLVDTLDVNLDFGKDYFDTAQIKLILENNFPIDVTTQLYLLDANNIVIDSLFQDGEIFLKGGTFSGTSALTNVEKQTFFIDFTDEKITNLMNTKRILAKPTFLSTPQGTDPIWIYDTYGLSIKMGAKFSLE